MKDNPESSCAFFQPGFVLQCVRSFVRGEGLWLRLWVSPCSMILQDPYPHTHTHISCCAEREERTQEVED